MNLRNIKTIAFDADDTLWINEINYQETERLFCSLLSEYLTEKEISDELLKTEMQNIEIYGYGAKSFILSMIETAIRISNNYGNNDIINEILMIGKQLINKPVELIDNTKEVLSKLSQNYKLMLATKGDLLDQNRKLENSSLSGYFDHIEILNDKKEKDYKNILDKYNISPNEFLMVGNSLKSDILPVLGIGARAIYIPHQTTWEFEKINEIKRNDYLTVKNISELLTFI